jgi:iron-sulfur cluster assembly protein
MMEAAKVQLSESAADRIREVVSQGKIPSSGGLRLAVHGGGCSGLTYAVRFDPEPKPRDNVYEFDGARVFVDPKSLVYVAGTVVDFESSLLQQRFVLHNPNAGKSCSCGESFSPL